MKKELKPKKPKKEKKLDEIAKLKKEMGKGLMTKPVLSTPENAMCRNLVVQYYEIQEIRKAMNNAKNMIARDYPKFSTTPQERVIKQVEELESRIGGELQSHVESLRIYGWLRLINGIGPTISIGLISALQTPEKFNNPSKMIRMCGLAPVEWCKECNHRYVPSSERETWAYDEAVRIEERKADDKQDVEKKQKDILKLLCSCEEPEVFHVAERKVRGLPIHYSPFLKTLTTYKVGHLGFIMHKGFYRNYYDKFRAEEDKKHPDLSDGHRMARARRKAVKLFITHFWNAWRRSMGLSITTPYVMKVGGHNYIPPPYENVIKYLEDEHKKGQHKKVKKPKTK